MSSVSISPRGAWPLLSPARLGGRLTVSSHRPRHRAGRETGVDEEKSPQTGRTTVPESRQAVVLSGEI